MQNQQSNLNRQILQNKTNWRYILIVALLAAVVAGGVLGWQYRQALKELKEEIKILKQENLPMGWQTYSNQELGVAFSYPDFWGKVKLFQTQGPTECAMGQRIVSGTEVSLRFLGNSSTNLYFTSPDYKSALCLLNNKGESEEIVSGFARTCEPYYPPGFSKVFECKSSDIANSSGVSFYTADQWMQSCGYDSDKHIKFNSPSKNFSGINIIASIPMDYESGCGRGTIPDITLEEFRDLRTRQLKENQLPFEANQFLWEFDNFIKTIKFI